MTPAALLVELGQADTPLSLASAQHFKGFFCTLDLYFHGPADVHVVGGVFPEEPGGRGPRQLKKEMGVIRLCSLLDIAHGCIERLIQLVIEPMGV